ncbi:hypothetical protein [Streptomyces antarcticus]|nr:hypothetical protein [Streptomyces sp. H34-AA3]MCY0945356.1 hypothetical protein [Streptomyces sp. H34-AA3]
MKLGNALAALLLAVAAVSSFLIWTKGSCGLWTYAKAGDTPARCVTHLR